ncbi:hypothetical protein GCM10011505_33830 [Tistrella bauzanensis]|uniref:Uncharacterized protein n=1 Tax=Tistrella bauzanensis TaxID=657419 RepID=A0ABQ1IT91_9PROT|nr:hypothetical protein [Tistrella bauzanensis]GGB49962.1 hypothetical protein GCM10011505_33830 [Tistrella bauzanensis]
MRWHDASRPPDAAELAEAMGEMAVRSLRLDRDSAAAGTVDAVLDGLRQHIGRLEQML